MSSAMPSPTLSLFVAIGMAAMIVMGFLSLIGFFLDKRRESARRRGQGNE